jgi:hypothetical protein
MDLVFYSAALDSHSERFLRELQSVISGGQIIVCHSLEEFSGSLSRPIYDLLAVVLLITDRRDLGAILALSNLLWDMRIIVILPDHTNETIARGHKLRPRFLTFMDTDSREVSAVLAKMLSNRLGKANERMSV